MRDVIAVLTGQDKRGKGIKKSDIQDAARKQIGEDMHFDQEIFDRMLSEMCKVSANNICKLKPMFK